MTTETQNITFEEVRGKFKEMAALFKNEQSTDIKQEFFKNYLQMAYKHLIDGFDQIESIERLQKRFLELPGLISQLEEKTKALEEDPEWHKRVKREEAKKLDEELQKLQAELDANPNDIEVRKGTAMANFINVQYYVDRAEMVKRLE